MAESQRDYPQDGLSSPPDMLLTRLQETGWAPVAGFSLLAINQLVEQLGIKPGEVIITRHGEVEVVYRLRHELGCPRRENPKLRCTCVNLLLTRGDEREVFEPVVPPLPEATKILHELGIGSIDSKLYTHQLPEYGDVIEVDKFRELVRTSCFVDNDGHGYPCKGGMMDPSIWIRPSRLDKIPKDATHICWFNK